MHARGTDLIHANWAVCGVIAGTVGRLRRKPVITTLRGDDVTRADRSRLDRVILASAVHNSRIITCVSEGMAERLRKRFPARAADIHACLNGVDDAFFQIGRTAAHGDALRLLAVGSLIRRKGFDVLIEAIARTRNREHVVVCIVGEGPELGSLQALAASRRVSSCFRFLGAVPGTDMPKRFSEADAFVLSSRSEGRPNVVVEALASGLPVISTDLEGVQGMVKNGDTGWLVPVDDSAALAAALDQAAADRSELRRRGERARVLARGTIGTWTDTARCYAALFRVVLGSGERQHSSCAG